MRARLFPILAAFAVLYVLSPVDLVPDVPVAGWFDDAAVVAATMLVGAARKKRDRRRNTVTAK